jgi:hypothetical protein
MSGPGGCRGSYIGSMMGSENRFLPLAQADPRLGIMLGVR